MSNFLLPAYYDAGDTAGPYNFMGKLSAPFTLGDQAYWILRQPGQPAQAVFSNGYPEDRKALKLLPGSRAAKRLAA